MDESKLIAELTVAEFKALFVECMQTYSHGQESGTAQQQQQAAGTREQFRYGLERSIVAMNQNPICFGFQLDKLE